MYGSHRSVMEKNDISTNAGGTEKTPKRRGGNRIPDPHDAFIKVLLSDPNRLLSLLLDQLPKEDYRTVRRVTARDCREQFFR